MASTKDWALKMIPVLVRWAQTSWDRTHYYSDLTKAIGLKTNQIGRMMGEVQTILDKHFESIGSKEKITLNALVVNKGTNLPSDGFDFVISNYSKLSPDSKRGEVMKLNRVAHEYKHWNEMLLALNLKPARIFSDNDIHNLKAGSYGNGGEGEEHKAIKKFILEHPSTINKTWKVIQSSTEELLPSGDRLDVFFVLKDGDHIAIEVKPSTSPDSDITRGLFQCIKYKVVMDAARALDNGQYENEAVIVIAGKMSEANKLLANDLHVHYIEQYKMESPEIK